jgi:hypothetical protein
VAVITTEVLVLGFCVVTVKVAEVFPACTTTPLGTAAMLGLLLIRVTLVPLAGAGPVKVTVPTDGPPPVTAVGLSVKEASTGGFTRSVADSVVVPSEAVMVALTPEATGVVVTLKVAELAPAGKLMLAGTTAQA